MRSLKNPCSLELGSVNRGSGTLKVNVITSSRWGGPQTWARDLSTLLCEQNIDATHTYKRRDLLAKLIHQSADIVHTTIPLPFRLWNKPTVLTVKGDYTIEPNFYHSFYPGAIRNADVVTTPSQYLKDKLGLKDAVVIPNAVFPEKFTVAQHQDREKIRLMTVANFYFPDKVEGLLRLWKIIQQILKPGTYEWFIFGGGPYLDSFRTVVEAGDRLNVHVRGFTPCLDSLYSTFDIFLHYSLHDNFPTVLLEALACLPKDSLILALPRPVAINKLAARRSVLASNGHFQKVLAKQRRAYEGTMVTVHGYGLLPFSITATHEVRVANVVRRARGNDWSKRKITGLCWKQAKDLQVGDFLVFPWMASPKSRAYLHFNIVRNTSKETPDCVISSVYPLREIRINSEIAYMLGFYLADGSPGKISVGLDRNDAEVLAGIIERNLGYKAAIVEGKFNNIDVKFGGPILARWFKNHFGDCAKSKHIPKEVLRSTDVKSFLRGYLKGDGHITKTGRLTFSTVSISLALQLQQLLSRLGIFGAIRRAERRTESKIRGRTVNGSRYHYCINVGKAVAYRMGLDRVAAKHKSLIIEDWVNRAFYVPIKTVEQSHFKGRVFNMTTGDSTFSVSNVTVHNCGLPVLTNQVGAVDGIVAPGTGFVAADDDAYSRDLECLVGSVSLRRDMGLRAHDYVDEVFNWHKIVGRYVDIYRKLAP